MRKIKAVILANEKPGDHLLWEESCIDHQKSLEFRVVNLTGNTWLEDIQKESFDILLASPGNLSSSFKQLYDERIYILGKILNYNIFPSPDEIFIYENKRFLSYWLKANQIPHSQTDVFYNKNEAYRLISVSNYPLVGKTSIGASGSGVQILNNAKEAIEYVDMAFSDSGIIKKYGPNFSLGNKLTRTIRYLKNPHEIIKKLNIYKSIGKDAQKGFVILQKYIPHDFEWRAVRIGNSFFAHKKIKKGEKASGSLLKGYENPPIHLLNFIRELTDRFLFRSLAIDIFEVSNGKYLVNEMQCIFGQSDPYQMLVDGKPGRYIFVDNEWTFEAGLFNANESYNLRIQYVIESFNEKI